MRLAFVNQPLGAFSVPPGGSIEIWTYEVARRLAALPDFDVRVYARHDPGQPYTEELQEFTVQRVRTSHDSRFARAALRRIRRLAPLLHGSDPPFAWGTAHLDYAVQVALDLRRRGTQVVHVHNFSQLVPVIRALNPNARIVLHMHCEWLVQLDRKRTLPRIDQSDLVLGCSEHITSGHRRRFPQYSHRFATLYNGVDTALFRDAREDDTNPHNNKTILFVGRVSPEKGVHLLVDAFERLLKGHPDARLEIVGPPWIPPRSLLVERSNDPHLQALAHFYPPHTHASYEQQLHARMSAEAAAQTRFVGQVPYRSLPAYYRRARVLVNPSLSEAFGMSLLEGLACGTPVAAARAGGMPEVVRDGMYGRTFEPDDPEDLASVVGHMLDDPAGSARLARQGQARVLERFSWTRITEDLRYYEEFVLGLRN